MHLDKQPEFIHPAAYADGIAQKACMIRDATLCIKRAQALRAQGRLSERYAASAIFNAAEYIATLRLLDSSEWAAINAELDRLHTAYGLTDGEEFPEGDKPAEVQALDGRLDTVVDDFIVTVLEDFEEPEIARLYKYNRQKLIRLLEMGRQEIAAVVH